MMKRQEMEEIKSGEIVNIIFESFIMTAFFRVRPPSWKVPLLRNHPFIAIFSLHISLYFASRL